MVVSWEVCGIVACSDPWKQSYMYHTHYRNKLICRRAEAVGLGLKSYRLSLTRWLFSDAIGLGAVGVDGHQARAKCCRVSLYHRLRLTRRPKNAVRLVIFSFLKKSKKLKKIIFYFLYFSFLLLFWYFSNDTGTMTSHLVTHPQIATSPARLTPKFYLNKLPLHY
jgi:hypothetical protein